MDSATAGQSWMNQQERQTAAKRMDDSTGIRLKQESNTKAVQGSHVSRTPGRLQATQVQGLHEFGDERFSSRSSSRVRGARQWYISAGQGPSQPSGDNSAARTNCGERPDSSKQAMLPASTAPTPRPLACRVFRAQYRRIIQTCRASRPGGNASLAGFADITALEIQGLTGHDAHILPTAVHGPSSHLPLQL